MADSLHNPAVTTAMAVNISLRPMPMIMKSKGWTSRWLDLRILLVAVTIQGVTPSAHNLASSRLLRILFETAARGESNTAHGETATACPVPHDECSPGGSGPPIDKYRKKTPGVLCLPVRTGWQAGPRRHAGRPLRIESVSENPWEALINPAQPCPPSIHTGVEQGTDLLHSLCRLTC